MRMTAADDQIRASGRSDELGSARGAIKEIEELENMLAERLKRVEETARAITSASREVDPDAMLARARAEAEAWSRGDPATHHVASSMSAAEVHAIIAERNNLRMQVRTQDHLHSFRRCCQWLLGVVAVAAEVVVAAVAGVEISQFAALCAMRHPAHSSA
jgi:hypothetical protein